MSSQTNEKSNIELVELNEDELDVVAGGRHLLYPHPHQRPHPHPHKFNSSSLIWAYR